MNDDIKNIGQNSLIQADCLEAMSYIQDKSIDMILCDLPYGTTQNKWDSVIPLDALWKEYERIIKPNGVIALTSQGVFTAQLITSNITLFKYKITWIKSKATNFLNAKKQPLRKHEDVCIFYRNKTYQPTYNPQMVEGEAYNKGHRKKQLTGSYGEFGSIEVKSDGLRYPSDVVYFKTAESEGEVFHPTQKPVALFEYLIKTYTNEGDLVLDNCAGSFTTAIACINTNRKYICIEQDEKYFNIGIERIDKHSNKVLTETPKEEVSEDEDFIKWGRMPGSATKPNVGYMYTHTNGSILKLTYDGKGFVLTATPINGVSTVVLQLPKQVETFKDIEYALEQATKAAKEFLQK